MTNRQARLARAWVEGRTNREIDRGHTAAEARRIALEAWDALPALERSVMLATGATTRLAFAVAGHTGAH